MAAIEDLRSDIEYLKGKLATAKTTAERETITKQIQDEINFLHEIQEEHSW